MTLLVLSIEPSGEEELSRMAEGWSPQLPHNIPHLMEELLLIREVEAGTDANDAPPGDEQRFLHYLVGSLQGPHPPLKEDHGRETVESSESAVFALRFILVHEQELRSDPN